MRLPSRLILLCLGFSAAISAISPALAAAWAPPKNLDPLLTKFVSDFRTHTVAAFYADCSLENGKKALMFFPAGSTDGYFVMMDYIKSPDRVLAGSAGYVSIQSGRLDVVKISGPSMKTMPALAGSLIAQDFRFIVPGQADALVRHVPIRAC